MLEQVELVKPTKKKPLQSGINMIHQENKSGKERFTSFEETSS